MGRSSIPAALVELAEPTTTEAQLNALRDVKNEIVGHDQRKELAVRHGVIKPLVAILRDSEHVEMRFQATLVVSSLARGGPPFVAPLLAANVLAPLFEALSPSDVSPRLVVATLRTLANIVDAMEHEKPWIDSSDGPIPPSISGAVTQQLFTKPVLEALAEILAQTAPSQNVYQQISLTTNLISKTCREDSQRRLVVEAGILDVLATKLAGIAAADAQALRMESMSLASDALPVTHLPDILEAICTIIQGSPYHSARLLYSQSLQQLFCSHKGATSGTFDTYSGPQTIPWEKLIPRLQTKQPRSDHYSKSWPALGPYNPGGTGHSYTRLPGMDLLQPTSRNAVSDDSETSFFSWLIYVARRGHARERVSACWLLALLKKFGERWQLNDPPRETRERYFAVLLVPILVAIIEEANPASERLKKATSSNIQTPEENQYVLERAPLVLAEIVVGNKTLQTAAVDARILPIICQILKKSFDPVLTATPPEWRAGPPSPTRRDAGIDPTSSTLGRKGLTVELLHVYKYRESSLIALAALADSLDPYRKLIIEQGAVNYITDSLTPFTNASHDSSSPTPNGNFTDAKKGNPDAVLIAACKVTRSLARSVSVLRTSLIDHGIAKPCFDLLTHSNIKVQIAATEVITNLMLEVSPVREVLLEAGAIKTLSEHCHSANFDLRLGSLWALKHLLLGTSPANKYKCLEEMGTGWLIQTLSGELSRSNASAPLGMGTSNAAGEQVDLLNAVDDPHMDVDEESSSDDDEDKMTDSIPGMRRHDRPGSRYTSAANIRDRLQQIKNDEQDPRLNAERDDLRIQEQALDFIRNFLNETRASGELIDHFLNHIGHSRFFEMLDSKIRPKSTQGQNYWGSNPSRSGFSQNPNWSAYPPPELIAAAVYILVHVANGRPSHRSLLIQQQPLMSHVLPLVQHPRREVRVACAWFINNLTWVENAHDDGRDSRVRATELRNLGFDEAIRILKSDSDLDIRERAKTGEEQFRKLLGEGTFGGEPAGSGLGRLGSLNPHRGWQRET